ncbi:MAG: HXXEE domain-containing protein [Gammaproteobacteria bacterium]|nr:HXXEE domain-containing protein [Gammaproteobacteria bacterium]
MTESLAKFSVAPRVALLLPFAYLLHLAEEWFGGLSRWSLQVLGNEISIERFIMINALAFPAFLAGTWAAFYSARMVWFVVMLATVLGLNGVVHALATLGFGLYAPGVITGVVVYMPLSFVVLMACKPRISKTVFYAAMLSGVVFHGLISFFAFS